MPARVDAEVCENYQVIIEEHYHNFVEDFKSYSSVVPMRSYSGVRNHVNGTQEYERHQLEVRILIEHSWESDKKNPSEKRYGPIEFRKLASMIMDTSVHVFKFVFVGPTHNVVMIIMQPN